MILLARFVAASRALGERTTVYVHVYPTLDILRTAMAAFNGAPREQTEDAVGATQAWTDPHGKILAVVVRLAATHLNLQIVSHEIHHAATALYGAHREDCQTCREDRLDHCNEPFAYLYSDLLTATYARLGCG